VAAAQYRQLQTGTGPIVRVLLANAGTNMLRGPDTAAMLKRMAAADPRIISVVGLDQSRQPTINTIKDLAGAGLPVVAATLSADVLAGQGTDPPITPFYFQIAPQNQREAWFVALYTDRVLVPHAGNARVVRAVEVLYSSDEADTYSNNLEMDTAVAFHHAGFSVYPEVFTPDNAASVGRSACGFRGFIFFAGRSEDFRDFLGGVDARCPGDPPQIMGDDDVARFVADPANLNLYPAVPFSYVSFAIGQTSCNKATGNDLYGIMDALFTFECNSRYATLDGHAALAYDTAETIVQAVECLQPADGPSVPVTPGTVWHAISSLHDKCAYAGQSGEIDFGGVVTQHVPLDKAVAIMGVKGPAQPTREALCGASGHLALHPDAWCPADKPPQP
jgi:hypothetical protein